MWVKCLSIHKLHDFLTITSDYLSQFETNIVNDELGWIWTETVKVYSAWKERIKPRPVRGPPFDFRHAVIQYMN